MALDYRQSGIDYRHAGASYRGVLDATVTPAVVAVAAGVSSPVVSGDADVAATTVAGTVAVPSPTVTGTAVVAATTVACTTGASSPTVTGAAVVAATTVAAVAALPAAQAAQTANATPDSIPGVAAIGSPNQTRRVVLTTTDTLPPLAEGEPDYRPLEAANMLARHYPQRAKGVNVWIADGAVTTTQPVTPAAVATITRVLHGGHESPDDLTDTEATLLAADGYRIDVEAA